MNATKLGSSQYGPFWRADHSRPWKEDGEQGWHGDGRLSRSLDARDGTLATCLKISAPYCWSVDEAKQDTQLFRTQMKKTGDFASGVRMHPGRWPVTGLPWSRRICRIILSSLSSREEMRDRESGHGERKKMRTHAVSQLNSIPSAYSGIQDLSLYRESMPSSSKSAIRNVACIVDEMKRATWQRLATYLAGVGTYLKACNCCASPQCIFRW